MSNNQRIRLFALVTGVSALTLASAVWAQNFGSAFSHKKIVLERKLPPTGHIDGTGIKVVVNAVGVQGTVAATLKSDLEDILLRNDPRLRTEEVHPDTIITCTVTSYAQPAGANGAAVRVPEQEQARAASIYGARHRNSDRGIQGRLANRSFACCRQRQSEL